MRNRRAPTMRYRVLDGKHSVELKLRTPHQLFDERDPAPFREKDLDDDAARYLHGSFRDLRGQGDIKISLYFSEMGEFHNRPLVIVDAIHAFFRFEADSKRRELRDIFRQGTMSLLIGLTFLFLCTWLAQGIVTSMSTSVATSSFANMAREGLAIMGWVAMWRPISIFLYEWWPIREAMATFQSLSEVEIEVLLNDVSEPNRGRQSSGQAKERGVRFTRSWKREPFSV